MFWGGFGYFEAVGFQKRNLAHYMYGDGLVVFGVVWGVLGRFGVFPGRRFPMFWWGLGWFWVVMVVSMDRTTAMLTDQIRKRVCLRFTDSSASRCRLTHDIWYPARCSAAHKN